MHDVNHFLHHKSIYENVRAIVDSYNLTLPFSLECLDSSFCATVDMDENEKKDIKPIIYIFNNGICMENGICRR